MFVVGGWQLKIISHQTSWCKSSCLWWTVKPAINPTGTTTPWMTQWSVPGTKRANAAAAS